MEPDDALESGSNTKNEEEPIETTPTEQEFSESSSDLTENILSTSEETLGTFTQWSEVEIPFKGPSSSGLSVDNNPFQVDFAVTFFDPAGNQIVIPGFYQGDGRAGME